MRAEQDNRIMKALGVLVIALLVLFLPPSEGRAVPGSDICVSPIPDTYGGATGDYDNDGFTNERECTGINFYGNQAHFRGYYERAAASDRTGYLNPSGKDLFFILVRANLTLIPDGPPATIYSNGLPVTVHEITSSDADTNRNVTSPQ